MIALLIVLCLIGTLYNILKSKELGLMEQLTASIKADAHAKSGVVVLDKYRNAEPAKLWVQIAVAATLLSPMGVVMLIVDLIAFLREHEEHHKPAHKPHRAHKREVL